MRVSLGQGGLSYHRICHAIEVAPVHCQPYTAAGRWCVPSSQRSLRSRSCTAGTLQPPHTGTSTSPKVQVMHASLPPAPWTNSRLGKIVRNFLS